MSGEEIKREKRKYVSEHDPVYLQERKKGQEILLHDVFGRQEVSTYEHNVEMIEKIEQQVRDERSANEKYLQDPESTEARRLTAIWERDLKYANRTRVNRGNGLRSAFHALASNTILLHAHIGYEKRKEYVVSELRQMFAAPEIQNELRAVYGEDLKKFDTLTLLGRVSDKTLSDELLYTAAKRHNERIVEQERRLEILVEETKREFKESVQKAVREGWLPSAAEKALSRIDGIPVYIRDRLTRVFSDSMGESHGSGKVTVTNEDFEKTDVAELKRILFHEFLHEISGKSITIASRTEEGWAEPFHKIVHRKSGVSLKGQYSEYSPFTWLNEAITEWLTLRLSGYAGDTGDHAYKGSSAYPVERRELDRLFEQGLSENLVLNSFFENIAADQSRETRGKYFAELVQRINSLEEVPFAFTRLENKHVLRKIANRMLDEFAIPKSLSVGRDKLPSGTAIFTIHVAVGVRPDTPGKRPDVQAKEDFIFTARDYDDGTFKFSIEDSWKRMENLLKFLGLEYGRKLTCEVTREQIP